MSPRMKPRLDFGGLPDAITTSAQGLDGCTINACGRPLVSRGMCEHHYRTWVRKTPKEQRGPAQRLRRKTPAERFFEKVDVRGPDECWPWMGSRNKRTGHGQFFVSRERRYIGAHAFAVELATGAPRPDGMFACHHCDNPPCCNPKHLYYGTPKDNIRDMWDRGLAPRGSARVESKLTEAEVLEIRTRYAASGETQASLAALYSVSAGTIADVVTGRLWTHVGGPITRRRPRKEGSA